MSTCFRRYYILWNSVSLKGCYSVISLLALKNCSRHPVLLFLVLIMVQKSHGYARPLPLGTLFLVHHSGSKEIAKEASFVARKCLHPNLVTCSMITHIFPHLLAVDEDFSPI